MSYRTSDHDCSIGVICSGEDIETNSSSEEHETQDKQDHWNSDREATKWSVLEKISKHSFVPLSDSVDDTDAHRNMPITDTFLPFSFEDQEFFFFVGRIFYRMRIIDIVLSLANEEEIEGAIDCESKDETCSQNSEYRDWYVGEKFPKNSWKCHHRDKDDDRRHHS